MQYKIKKVDQNKRTRNKNICEIKILNLYYALKWVETMKTPQNLKLRHHTYGTYYVT